MNACAKRRIGCVLIFFWAGLAAIVFNLYLIQIRYHQFYTQLATRQYHVHTTIMPPRAVITDRSGKHFLAMNKESLAAFILPKNLESPKKLLPFLEQHFPSVLQRLLTHKDSHFLYVQRRLTEEQKKLIEESGITDIKFLAEPSRFYPVPSVGPLIGITDIDNQGLSGIELHFNERLAGKPSTYILEKDARSNHFYFKKETKIQGHQGQMVQLTLDAMLQFIVYEELEQTMKTFGAKEGAALVINPANGEILALVSLPDFDANNHAQVNLELMKNIAIQNAYELGSVFKAFSALIALQEQVVTPDEVFDCKNTKTAYIDGRKINTVLAGGLLTFAQIIEQSNNIGMAQVTKRLGTKLYDHYCRLGFGKKTGIAFPSEHSGFVNSPENWSKQSLISLSYGYEISCTLLQLARAFCIIARNGLDLDLRLVLEPSMHKVATSTRLYDEHYCKTLKKILEGTTLKRRWKPSALASYHVMSKTGTANMLIDGQYCPTHNLYTCAGIIEHGNYQRVIVTFIKEINKQNVYAATIAAPLFDTIAEKLVIHDKIM